MTQTNPPRIYTITHPGGARTWSTHRNQEFFHQFGDHKIMSKSLQTAMNGEQVKTEFAQLFQAMAQIAHQNAVDKGFWEEDRNDAEMLMLMVSELSEALEAIRHGNPPDDKLPEFNGYEAELADCIIRILDTTAARNLRVGQAIIAKMAYNENREYKHGKAF